MKTGLTLEQLAAEITRQQNAKEDYVVNTGNLRFECYGHDLALHVLNNDGADRIEPLEIGDIAYRQRICNILHDDFLYDFLSRFYPDDRQKLEHFCAFIVPGNLNLALTWLNGGAMESPEEMAQLAGKIIMNGVGGLK